MAKCCVVTMGDDRFKPITSLTFPKTKAYAEKIGAHFHLIENRIYPSVNICYEKFQIGSLLDRFDRVLYVDGDVLIRPSAWNVFDVVPFGMFGAMNEGEHISFWNPELIEGQFAPYGWTGPWNGRHFNAGVMVLDSTHKKLFENPIITDKPYWDQPYFNVMVERLKIPYFSLPPEFNYLVFHPYKKPNDFRSKASFLHFSGTMMSPEEKAVHVKKEIDSHAG